MLVNPISLVRMPIRSGREEIIDTGFLPVLRELDRNCSRRRFDTEPNRYASSNLANHHVGIGLPFICVEEEAFAGAAVNENPMHAVLDHKINHSAAAFLVDALVLLQWSHDQALVSADFFRHIFTPRPPEAALSQRNPQESSCHRSLSFRTQGHAADVA